MTVKEVERKMNDIQDNVEAHAIFLAKNYADSKCSDLDWIEDDLVEYVDTLCVLYDISDGLTILRLETIATDSFYLYANAFLDSKMEG